MEHGLGYIQAAVSAKNLHATRTTSPRPSPECDDLAQDISKRESDSPDLKP